MPLEAADAELFKGNPPKGLLKQRRQKLANDVLAFIDGNRALFPHSTQGKLKVKELTEADMEGVVMQKITSVAQAAANRSAADATGASGDGRDRGDADNYILRAASGVAATKKRVAVPLREKRYKYMNGIGRKKKTHFEIKGVRGVSGIL